MKKFPDFSLTLLSLKTDYNTILTIFLQYGKETMRMAGRQNILQTMTACTNQHVHAHLILLCVQNIYYHMYM